MDFNLYDCTDKSIEEIQKLNSDPKAMNCKVLRVINSDTLSSMRGLDRFTKLEELNLSCNQIERMESLDTLTSLKSINLASNKIRVINNLQRLQKLEVLNLAGNKITSLINLKQMGGPNYRLNYIDLRDNKLQDLRELIVFNQLTSLKTLYLNLGPQETNPFCKDYISYSGALLAIKGLSEVKIDNKTQIQLKVEYKNLKDLRDEQNSQKEESNNQKNSMKGSKRDGAKQKSRDNTVEKKPSVQAQPQPQQFQQQQFQNPNQHGNQNQFQGYYMHNQNMTQPSLEYTNSQSQGHMYPSQQNFNLQPNQANFQMDSRVNSADQNLTYNPFNLNQSPSYQNQGYNSQQQRQSVNQDHDQVQLEVFHLQNKQEEIKEEKARLQQKLELNDKYWLQRLRVLEEKQSDVQQKLLDSANMLKMAEQQQQFLIAENERFKDMNLALTSNQKQHDVSFEKYQDKLGQLMKDNGDLYRQREIVVKERDQLTKDLLVAKNSIKELRQQVKDQESQLSKVLSNSMESNTQNIKRFEDLQRENKQLKKTRETEQNENSELKERILELVQENKDWEIRYNLKLNQIEREAEERVTELNNSWEDKLNKVQTEFQSILVEREDKFKDNMNKLEEEFKNLLLEREEKFKRAKDELRNLLESERELKSALKIAISKNREQNEIIGQQTETLVLLKRERDARDQNEENTHKKCQILEDELRLENQKLTKELSRVNLNFKDLEEREQDASSELQITKRQISGLKKENYELLLKVEEQRDVVLRIEEKFKELENRNMEELVQLKEEKQDLGDTLKIKNKLLEDQNQQIENLKISVQMKQAEVEREKRKLQESDDIQKGSYNQLLDEIDKKQQKITNQRNLLNDYEERIQQLEYDAEEHQRHLKENKREIKEKGKQIEECVDQIKELNKHKNDELKDQSDKIHKIDQERQRLLELLRSKEDQVEKIERHLVDIDSVYQSQVIKLQNENKNLQRECDAKEKDIKTLINEIDNQKKAAKENLKNLAKLFN